MQPIHIQIQNINTKLESLEVKLDTLLAQPAIPPELNIGGLIETLGQIMGKTDLIYSAVAPTTQPDLTQQAQQAIQTLQAIQEQLQQQVQQVNAIVAPLEPEPLE